MSSGPIMVMPMSFSLVQPWRWNSSSMMSCLPAVRPMPPNSRGQPGASQPFSDSLKDQTLFSEKCSRLVGLRSSGG